MNTDIRDAVLKLYNEGKSIVPAMSGVKCGESPVCSLIGKTIIIPDYDGKGYLKDKDLLLGEGAGGYVWTALIDGVEFAVKTRYSDKPFDEKSCVTNRQIDDKSKSRYNSIIPKGSYLCDDYYSDFIIGSLCSRLYENGISANFLRMYDFAACTVDRPNKHRQYIFMEKADMKIEELSMKQLVTVDIFIQIMHAIHTYQTSYKISHNDLHMGNIMLQKIGPEHEFNGKKIMDYKYFHYRFGDADYYVRNMGLVVKIIDFGIAQKYSKPFILYKEANQRIPYRPIVDVLVVMKNLFKLMHAKVFRMDLDYDESLGVYFRDLMNEIQETMSNNPSPEELERYTPANIMNASRFVEIRPKPRKGSIITMGDA